MYNDFHALRSYAWPQQSVDRYSDVHGSRINRLVGVAVIAALALPLVLLGRLLRCLFFLLLALTLSLVFIALFFTVASALALLVLLLSILSGIGLGFRLSFLR